VLEEPPRTALARIETELGLRDYQRRALRSFVDRGGRGIAHMATGTGKTRVGLGAIEWVRAGNQRALVVVPTRALLHQWRADLAEHTDAEEAEVAAVSGSANLRRVEESPVAITPIQTACRNPDVLTRMAEEDDRRLLVVDECHRAGAPAYSQALVDAFDYRLGLSATPQRPYDPQGTQRLLDYFEGVAYRYELRDAVDEGHLADYEYHLHSTYLTEREQQAYEDLNGQLNLVIAEIDDSFEDPPGMENLGELLALLRAEGAGELAEDLQDLLFARARIVKNARGKIDVFERMSDRLSDKKTIVFAEEIDFAEDLARRASNQGLRTLVYHSEMGDDERDRTLATYRQMEAGALVTVRALDEGLDVPDADAAVLAASSTSERQHVQRRGRVLRPLRREAKTAEIHDFYVVGVDDPYRVARIREDAEKVRLHGFEDDRRQPWERVDLATVGSSFEA
jgi:superfamily II DNA or RNA helicase